MSLRRDALAGSAEMVLAAERIALGMTTKARVEATRKALDEFEKANPDIKVTLQRVSWSEAQQQYLREAAVGAVLQFINGRERGAHAVGEHGLHLRFQCSADAAQMLALAQQSRGIVALNALEGEAPNAQAQDEGIGEERPVDRCRQQMPRRILAEWMRLSPPIRKASRISSTRSCGEAPGDWVSISKKVKACGSPRSLSRRAMVRVIRTSSGASEFAACRVW